MLGLFGMHHDLGTSAEKTSVPGWNVGDIQDFYEGGVAEILPAIDSIMEVGVVLARGSLTLV